LMMTVLVAATALSIDIGLHYYLGAKLQNAVDSAATAIAAELGSTNDSLEDTAYEYLASNGFDRNGNYDGKINVEITPKAVVDVASASDDDYITSGYYKVTATVQDDSVLGKVLGIESYQLQKTAYAKCEANYTKMPDALAYTVFGGDTNDSSLGTVRLAGKTSQTANNVTNWMEDLINGVNSKIVQPVKGWLGGSVDYSGININTSAIITNGDVHSNSNIMIGAQALNTSRVKDVDYSGSVSSNDETEDETDNSYIDYGQVTYSAGTNIEFNYSGQNDKSRIYVQNQQYLEDTQIVLNVINQLDFSRITSTLSLKNLFKVEATEYVKGLGGAYYTKSNSSFTDKGTNLIERLDEQAENLRYDSDGKFYLDNQNMIVYAINGSTAKSMLEKTASEGLDTLNNSIVSSSGTGSDPVYSGESSSVFYYPGKTSNPVVDTESSTKDNGTSLSYDVEFTKQDSDKTATLSISGTQLNRDYSNLMSAYADSINNATANGARFAIARTFIENSDYIATPNMKPYFARQIKNSIKNATTTSDNKEGSTSVKEVVATTGEELETYANSIKYTDDKYAELDSSGEVKTFDKTSAANQMFSSIKLSESDGLVDLTSGSYSYQTTDLNSKVIQNWTVSNTSFKGYKLYNSNNTLKSPKQFIEEFATKYITPDSETGESDYGEGAIKKYYNNSVLSDGDYDDYTVSDYENHYSNSAVQKKKTYLKENESYDSIGNNFGSFKSIADDSNDVFLKELKGTPYNTFSQGLSEIKESVEENPISEGSKTTVDEPDEATPDFEHYPSVPKKTAVPNKTVTLGKKTYKDSDFITSDDNGGTYNQSVADLISQYSNDISSSWVKNAQLTRCDYSSSTNKSGSYHKVSSDTYAHGTDQGQHYSGRGFVVESNKAVWVDDYIRTGTTNSNQLHVLSNGILLVGGANTITVDSKKYALYVDNSCEIDEGAVAVVGGKTYVKSGLTVGKNAVLIVNGDLYVNGSISIGEGATVIVTGVMTANNKAVSIGNSASVYIDGGLVYAEGSGNGKLTFGTNSTLVIFNSVNSDTKINYDTVLNSGTTLYVKKTLYVWNTLTINSGATVYAQNLYKYSNCSAGLDITVSGGASFYSDGSIDARNISDSSSISVFGNVALTGTLTTTCAYASGNVSVDELKAYQLKIGADCTVNKLTYIGNLLVGGKLKVNSDYTTDGKIQADSFECTGTLTNTSNCLNVTTKIKAKKIVNSSILYSKGAITVDGDLINGTSSVKDAVIYAGGVITVGGDLTNYGKIACVNDSKDYAIVVSGTTDEYSGAVIYTSKGSFKTNDLILNKNCEFSIKEDLTIEGVLYNNTLLDINGEFSANKIENNSLIYVDSSITIEYLIINEGAKFACNGSLTLTDANDSGKSLFIEGECYIKGDINAAGTVYVDKGKLYVYGDLVAANKANDYNIDNALWVENHSLVYIRGYVNSESEDMHIWIQEHAYTGTYTNAPTKTVVSIYGSLYHNSSIGKNITEFANEQEGSTVYLGTGALDLSFITYTVEFDGVNAFVNAGTTYVYGSLSLPNATNVKLYNSGYTYVMDEFSAPNATVNVTNTHTLVCFDDASIGSINCDNSNIYILGKATVSGNITLNNYSEFYIGKNSSVDMSNASISYSTVYLPKQKTAIYYNKVFSGNCGLVTDSDVVFTADTTIPSGIKLYIGGKTIMQNCTITNQGSMYLVGTVDENSNSKSPFRFSENSDSYIGVVSDTIGTTAVNGTLYYPDYYWGDGTVYIENNLQTAGYTSSVNVGNRNTGLYVQSGKTCVSGSVTVSDQQGVLINENASISCMNDFTLGSTIWNYGKFIVEKGNLVVHNGANCTDTKDSNLHVGISLLNGGKSEGVYTDAVFYVGGTKAIDFYGYVRNNGSIYLNSSLNVQGYDIEDKGVTGDIAFLNYAGSTAHINGYVHLNSNVLYNKWDATFACNGNLKFGECLYNCGTLVATGDITNSEGTDTINKPSYTNGKDGEYKSLMNGAYKTSYNDYYKSVYPDALIYCGGNLQLGYSEDAGNAGSLISYGTMYVGGNLNEYTSKGNSYYMTAIWLYNNTNTFIGGNCFGGAGIATGSNSIFMCGGDLESKRSLKINAQFKTLTYVDVGSFTTYTDTDDYTPAYFYVGGNMLANVLGKPVYERQSTLSTKVPENCSRDLDVYSNSNVFVGGSVYANSKVYLKQNVNFIVCGEKSIYSPNGTGLIDRIEAALKPDVLKYVIQSAIDGNDYKFFAYQSLDENVCSHLIINGDAYVKDTSKIRDMSKTYIYGNFKCADYVELGKALDGADETEAKESLFRDSDDSDGDAYTTAYYKNAMYMYVGGDYRSSGYTRLFASSTLRVRDDFTTFSTSSGYLELDHDAKIYVGKKLKANGKGYYDLTLKGILKGTTKEFGIRGSTYSQFYVKGSMQATTSSIIIKDASTCIVGGNMSSYLGSISLGESGDFAREAHTVSDGAEVKDCECCDNCTNMAGCTCGCSNCLYDTLDCNCCDDCTNDEFCECECDDCTCSATTSTNASNDNMGYEEQDYYQRRIDTANELQSDKSDSAVGGTFFIGGTLASYTSFIKEYAYSKVVVGNYVYTPDYLTVRHNADLWVLPEMFDNVTSKKFKYSGCEYCTCDNCIINDPSTIAECHCCKDCENSNLWGKIKTSVSNALSSASDSLTPKQGSIYSLGELTLNLNSSLMGTYDCIVYGQTVLRENTLVYLGHDFTCTAPSVNIVNYIENGNILGFESYGAAADSNAATTFPVVIYADNNITISTSIKMQLTYLIANYGDVYLYDAYSSSDNADNNIKQLPNAVCSYQGNIDYYAMYSKIAALFYAPASGYRVNRDCNCCTKCSNAYKYSKSTCDCDCDDCKCGEVGVIDLDGYYQEIWGSVIGNRVKANTFYLTLHRFTNWRDMDLHIAESGTISLISQEEYENAVQYEDDEYDIYELNDNSDGGASLFFNTQE
jgi:Flp pilus assembly protein TadG